MQENPARKTNCGTGGDHADEGTHEIEHEVCVAEIAKGHSASED